MNPDYSNQYYRTVRYSVNRKRQIINETLAELHTMHMAMIEDAVAAQEYAGFPEANEVINYIKGL
jgi:glutathionylspermidine synthase